METPSDARPRRTRSASLAGCALLAAASAIGCARVVLVPESAPVRIGPDCRTRVYALGTDGAWELSANRVCVPEGWYAVPPSFVEGADE